MDNKKTASLVPHKYLAPFVLITSLFFLWGFSRSILDVLNKHFQDVMALSKTESGLIQAAVYTAYFLVAIPAGLYITRRGYRQGVVLGLLLFAAGAFMFIPGEALGSFGFFLAALFVLGCGLVFLETAANPYAANLGDPRTSASRLNLAQAFNGMGCIFGPLIFGGILFSEGEDGSIGALAIPYSVMGVVVLLVAWIFTRVDLPEIKQDGGDSPAEKGISLWAYKPFVFGLAAIFFYEIAEISINSFFINYFTEDGSISAADASKLLSICGLGLFFAGRLIGSGVMRHVSAQKVLLVCALATVCCTLLVICFGPRLGRWALCACYLFESIMFPTIFALSVSGIGNLSKRASSFLMMSPIGGAIGTLCMGFVADHSNMSISFVVPMCGYAVVLAFAIYMSLRPATKKSV
ncbi:MAG: sugar MFS transporter [Clostridium sp.]|nr:sugar MFS transporter [Clostridium sp.]